jgi:DNA polymerase-4
MTDRHEHVSPGQFTGPGGEGPAGGPPPDVFYVHFHRPQAPLGEDLYGCLLDLLGEITPVVQALPPDAAFADVGGALRYFGRGPGELAALLRVRTLARYGTDCTIGVAANPSLARMAAQDGPRGAVRVLPGEPEAVAGFLTDKPVAALAGVGPATARLLGEYGLDTVGRVAGAPLGTLQRLLGAAPARRLRDQALGRDPVPVTPNAPARSIGAERRFDRDELDPARQRRALLSLADELGSRLRSDGRVARSLTLTVRYADGAATVRGRTLPEPTGHTAALAETAYRIHASLGLQRARLRAVALRAEGLGPAELAAHQLTFDPADDKARRIEEITDLARERFGPGVVMPAAILGVA